MGWQVGTVVNDMNNFSWFEVRYFRFELKLSLLTLGQITKLFADKSEILGFSHPFHLGMTIDI